MSWPPRSTERTPMRVPRATTDGSRPDRKPRRHGEAGPADDRRRLRGLDRHGVAPGRDDPAVELVGRHHGNRGHVGEGGRCQGFGCVQHGRDRAGGPLSEHGTDDGHLFRIDRLLGLEEEAPARCVIGARLDPDDPVMTEVVVEVVEQSGHRERDLAHGHDLREGRLAHGRLAQSDEVGCGAHRSGVQPADVGEVSGGEPKARCGAVHFGDECRGAAGIPLGQEGGDVVARRNEHALQGLHLGEGFACGHLDHGLLGGQSGLIGRDGVRRHRDSGSGRARFQRMIFQDYIGGHHLGDARNGNGLGASDLAQAPHALHGERGGTGRRPGQGRGLPGKAHRCRDRRAEVRSGDGSGPLESCDHAEQGDQEDEAHRDEPAPGTPG